MTTEAARPAAGVSKTFITVQVTKQIVSLMRASDFLNAYGVPQNFHKYYRVPTSTCSRNPASAIGKITTKQCCTLGSLGVGRPFFYRGNKGMRNEIKFVIREIF